MKVYMAGPITAVGRVAAMAWRERLRRALEDRGIVTFDPAAAWIVPGMVDTGGAVQFVDDAAVAVCDVVVVACTIHESRGTDHEIRLALALDKPIVIYSLVPEAFADAWARERDLHDAPILCNQDAVVELLVEWRRNWKSN
jgi:nucleoside 2-deoxyribosyltransferase